MNDLEMKTLKILAKEFEYTQGLHVEISKLQMLMGLKKELDPILLSLEEQEMVNLYKEGEKIKLAKITWRGLNEIGDVSLKFGLGKDYYKNYDKEI
jgi:hypothetical protein